jgi:hypothetical protein
MARHEVAAMLEVRLHGFWPTPFHAQILRRVVTTVAIGLCMTRLAQALLLHGLGAMVLHEVAFMTQESLGQRALDLR